MKRVELEIQLSRLKDLNYRKSYLEQYSTTSNVASYLLYRATGEGDIAEKVVADLGTGNGIFAIGAFLLGAKKVYAIDIDDDAIDIAEENASSLGSDIEFLRGDISFFNQKVDTVMMNPPFGSQVRDADLPFIEKGLEISKNFYILFNFKTGDFLSKYIGKRGNVLWEEKIEMPLPHSFDFHRKEVKKIGVSISKVRVNEIRSARRIPGNSGGVYTWRRCIRG